jgi:hypothetical protein
MPSGRFQFTRLLGRLAEDHEQLADALVMRLPRIEHPVVVQLGEQIVGAVLASKAVATGDDVAGRLLPRSRRSVASVVLKLARALLSRTSGQNTPATRVRGRKPR